MPTLLSVCLALGRAIVMPRATLILENAALRHHDNDAIYGQYRPSVRVVLEGRPCRYRFHLDRWLHEVIAIRGIPIPY
jgi:hypothetical protein